MTDGTNAYIYQGSVAFIVPAARWMRQTIAVLTAWSGLIVGPHSGVKRLTPWPGRFLIALIPGQLSHEKLCKESIVRRSYIRKIYTSTC